MESLKSAETEARRPLEEKTVNGRPEITILGIGNLLLKDEGIGIHLAHRLAGMVEYTNLNVIDGGTDPDVLSLVDESTHKLIIIDAAEGGDEPGTIYRLNYDDLDLCSSDPVSLHELGILNSLKMMTLLNRRPETVVIIGVEPKTIDFGLELSPEVDEKIPRIIELVLDEIKATNTSLEVDR